jgi:probable selenate reductase FAD-binding subunit
MQYFAPKTLIEAERLRKNTKKTRRYFAGGTVLNWKGSPKVSGIIDLKGLGLNTISIKKRMIRMGACATIQDIADEPAMPAPIVEAAMSFSSINIRNMASIGGNIASRFFVSDMLPVLLAYRARVEYYNNARRHEALLSGWLKKRPGLICSVIIDNPGRLVKIKSEKIASTDFPLIVTAMGLSLKRGIVIEPDIAVSGAAAGTILLKNTAAYLKGKKPAMLEVEQLDKLIKNELKPQNNLKASADIKHRITLFHIKTMLEEFRKEL